MQSDLNVVALIPARAGSKRVPGKNVKLLGGKPLICYTIEQAIASSLIDSVYISSDDLLVKSIANDFNCNYISRPPSLSTDTATTELVVSHFLNHLDSQGVYPSAVVLLQPTVPFRSSFIIDDSISMLFSGNFDSIISHIPVDFYHPNRLKRPNGPYLVPYDQDELIGVSRSSLPEVLCRDGSVYTFSVPSFYKFNNLLGCSQGFVMTDPEHYVNIDTMRDWLLAESMQSYYFS